MDQPMATAACDIRIADLKKQFGLQRALRGVSLNVEAGTFLVVCGPNGAGKSTLLYILASLTRPTEGAVAVGGICPRTNPAAYRRQIGFVSHQTLLYENLTARENLLFFAQMYALPDAPVRIERMLERVGLAGKDDMLVRTMSRGTLQRLAIARALLHDPKLLLLDEPFTGLDIAAAERFNNLLDDYKHGGGTVVLTTHNVRLGMPLADRVAILVKGRIVFDKPAGGLKTEEVETAYGYWSEKFPT